MRLLEREPERKYCLTHYEDTVNALSEVFLRSLQTGGETMKSFLKMGMNFAEMAKATAFFGFCLLLAGCSTTFSNLIPTNVAATARPDIRKYNIQNIAVMPFRNNTDNSNAGHRVATFFYDEIVPHQKYSVTPPVLLDRTEEIELEFRVDPSRRAGTVNREENLRLLGRAVSRYLKRVQPYTTSNQLLFPGEFSEGDSNGETAEIRLSEAAGGEAEQALDAVVTGVITRYNDRNGNALSTDRPASVSFDVYLISVEDGKVLWNATFDETQGPLSDNLLMIGRFFKGGGVWQTNDALARNGMNRLVETFPGISTESREGSPEPPVPLEGETSGQ